MRRNGAKPGKTTFTDSNHFQEENAVCPVCKSDRYLNPNMKLLVSTCFHKMCESCIDRLFTQGPAPCPICQQVLRKTNFASQTFEDLHVEKEVRVRKRVAKFFNKRQEDFPTLRAYNDYLEELEEIIFNLINEVDVQETEEKIQRFADENKESISLNAARQLNEERLAQYKMTQEKKEKQLQREAYLQEMTEEEKLKKIEKEEVLNQLASSDKSAQDILASRAALALKKSSMRRQDFTNSRAMPNQQNWFLFHNEDLADEVLDDFDSVDTEYADVTNFTLQEQYYDPLVQPAQKEKIAKAGGFLVKFSYHRDVESAFNGLLLEPVPNEEPVDTPMDQS
ncbi:CDK-activating kinase assembly factor [Basidiobolus meristosporus CBS 931.73]|uniref:RNA polymerase II transcription factor B subunit 3 n=1 Tax=Basidiobolus meristosporus CBS 931.73 TaxID=1314790 RepID=A0A1Y1XUP5_9FUNG|nr:CDK-activating kinase assembly factor [Basidiobolus meristosporus CBS 931.73]|eukprot:ORX89479.1 CDK-activating kinase assembly factor [Basidiobolus meristosporus CBS 931.73]